MPTKWSVKALRKWFFLRVLQVCARKRSKASSSQTNPRLQGSRIIWSADDLIHQCRTQSRTHCVIKKIPPLARIVLHVKYSPAPDCRSTTILSVLVRTVRKLRAATGAGRHELPFVLRKITGQAILFDQGALLTRHAASEAPSQKERGSGSTVEAGSSTFRPPVCLDP